MFNDTEIAWRFECLRLAAESKSHETAAEIIARAKAYAEYVLGPVNSAKS